MQKIQIPKRDNTGSTLDRPLTIRLTLNQRRTADLMASVNGFDTTSEFVRELLTNASSQMNLIREVA